MVEANEDVQVDWDYGEENGDQEDWEAEADYGCEDFTTTPSLMKGVSYTE